MMWAAESAVACLLLQLFLSLAVLVTMFMCVYVVVTRSTSLCNMQCMLQTAPSVLVMGGHQPLLVSFDLETRQEIQQVVKCCQ